MPKIYLLTTQSPKYWGKGLDRGQEVTLSLAHFLEVRVMCLWLEREDLAAWLPGYF